MLSKSRRELPETNDSMKRTIACPTTAPGMLCGRLQPVGSRPARWVEPANYRWSVKDSEGTGVVLCGTEPKRRCMFQNQGERGHVAQLPTHPLNIARTTAVLGPPRLERLGPAPKPVPVPLSGTLPLGIPLLWYGLRLWAAVCLALFAAFSLELDSPFWAGTTAAVVCQPVVGAALRKGWFRLLGTVVGASVAVVLTACLPQDRFGFLLVLALWGGCCAFVASVLRNFASYAAALAGYTAVIVAADELGAVGGANAPIAFDLAVTRASEISIGIVCAGIVLAGTDLGGARRKLAVLLAAFSAEALDGLVAALRVTGAEQATSRPVRRDLIRRIGDLAIALEQAAGETSGYPFQPHALQAALGGLVHAVSAWRAVAAHLERAPEAIGEAEVVLRCLHDTLLILSKQGGEIPWQLQPPASVRNSLLLAVRRLVALPAGTPSTRLLADCAAEGLLGIHRTITGVAFLLGQRRRSALGPPLAAPTWAPDLLPALVAALRAFAVIGAAELTWIATAWPSGPTFIIFAAITTILFAPGEEAAYGMARNYMLGTAGAAILAAAIAFALLPQLSGFAAFCTALGLILVPAGALSAQTWRQPVFVAFTANFIPLLGPTNPESYDPGRFYNTAVALLAGVGFAMVAIRLVPPLPPGWRARRLLTLTLRDLRRLCTGPLRVPAAAWEGRVYGRLSAMPDGVEPLQRARLVATLSVGVGIIRLRRMVGQFHDRSALDAALQAIARGNSAAAMRSLGRLDRALAALPPGAPGLRSRLRARSAILAISDALAFHAPYFDADAPT